MGDRITFWADCPNCGGKETLECYEALSSNIKSDNCSECDYHISYNFKEVQGGYKIEKVYPKLVKSAPTPPRKEQRQ